jgi:WD40 repeat protein
MTHTSWAPGLLAGMLAATIATAGCGLGSDPEQFSPDSTLLLWAAETGGIVRSLEVTQDAQLVVAGLEARALYDRPARSNLTPPIPVPETLTGDLKVLRLADGDIVHDIWTTKPGRNFGIALTADGRYVMANAAKDTSVDQRDPWRWSSANYIGMFRLSDGARVRLFPDDHRWPFALMPAADAIVSASNFDSLSMTRLSDSSTVWTTGAFIFGTSVPRLRAMPDGSGIIEDGNFKIAMLSPTDGTRLWSDRRLGRSHTTIYGMSISGDSQLIAFARGSFAVVVRATDGETIASLGDSVEVDRLGGVEQVAFTGDERHIVAGGANGFIGIWRVDDGTRVASFIAHDGHITGIVVAPDGESMVTGGDDGVVRAWRMPILAAD